ncbi:hypothetical protein [Sphingobium sp. SCG-1]|uniref:hypothetical protein n=1 Tax=Sphingobium sp. SCG-1 TaxID=2072936 RepID=UPI00166FF002|nr:hypothetical protein [Sphingobium sp. SCG-1]
MATLVCAFLHGSLAAAQIPEELQSQECKSLFSQISAQPETDALMAWWKGDHRFYQLIGFALYVPLGPGNPIDQSGFTEKLQSANGLKTLLGVNDYGSSPDCVGFYKSAIRYVPRYNSTILDISLSEGIQTALSKLTKGKTTP